MALAVAATTSRAILRTVFSPLLLVQRF